jgi:hypothetical protein
MLVAAHLSWEMYPDEMSCFFGGPLLRALRVRVRALVCPLCDVVMRGHAFWLPNVLVDGVV